MAALSLTRKNLSSPYGGAALGNVPEAGATDDTTPNDGTTILVVDVTSANARTITFKDKAGTALTACNLAASELQVYGPFPVDEFGETLTFSTSNADVEVVPVKLSGGSLKNTLTRR